MIMKHSRRLGLLAIGFALVLGASPMVAQVNIEAAQKRFQQLFAAGKFQDAFAEATKTERQARRGGTNSFTYVLALNDLGRAQQALGHYAEAAQSFERVISLLRKNVPATDPNLIQVNANLAKVYLLMGRYGRAEAMFKAARDATAKTQGESPALATLIMNVGDVYRFQARYDEAEAEYAKALKLAEKTAGDESVEVADTLNNLTKIYEDQGRFDDAETVLARARAINEKTRPAHPAVAFNINNIAHLYERLGRYAESDREFQRAIALAEKSLGPKHPALATMLNNLASVYADEERFDEADALYKRALAIREGVYGATSTEVATVLNNMAQLYELQGRYADVEDYAGRSLAVVEKTLGPDNPDTAKVVRKLGVANTGLGRYDQAGQQFERALDIFTKTFGPDHRYIATVLISQADLFERQRRYDDADAALKRALTINRQTRGENHPEVARVLNRLAALNLARGDAKNALDYSRKATDAVLTHASADATARPGDSAGGLVEQRSTYFATHVASAAAARQAGLEKGPALDQEALENAQRAGQSAAAAAIQQLGARASAGNDALAKLVRENQDLTAFWRSRDRALTEALSKPSTPENAAIVATIRKQMADTETKISALTERLQREFSDFAALTNPKPMTREEVAQHLRDNEALVFLLVGDNESYVFALTRDGFEWKTIPYGYNAISDKVARFRKGLVVEADNPNARRDGFDLDAAHDLYETLIGPIAGLVRDKQHLLIVPSGPLTALPFHLLVTEKPALALPQDAANRASAEAERYRDAAWLIRRHAVTVLPSVASLKALRMEASMEPAGKPMIGFGDPVFGTEQPTPAPKQERGRKRSITRAYSEFWRGAGVDRGKLAEALPRLEETAVELNAIAKRLGAPASDIKLREDASEATIKRAPLDDYRVVYFATHGLVAGDVKGLAEPSLVFTLPVKPTQEDDGLLTASEVAQLKLNADWVVLSACNTIAGDRPGAEALSGLARAFFYAGARALLVSHWAVESNAATALTTATFKVMAENPGIGRAEALRRAMLAYLDDKTPGHSADPAYWGPFSIIGEGAQP